MLAVARLLREPGLARLYTYVLCAGEVTIDDVVDALNLPLARAISDADTAVELSVLTRTDDQADNRFTASPILLSVEVDGETQTVTPTLIDAVERPRDVPVLRVAVKPSAGALEPVDDVPGFRPTARLPGPCGST